MPVQVLFSHLVGVGNFEKVNKRALVQLRCDSVKNLLVWLSLCIKEAPAQIHDSH